MGQAELKTKIISAAGQTTGAGFEELVRSGLDRIKAIIEGDRRAREELAARVKSLEGAPRTIGTGMTASDSIAGQIAAIEQRLAARIDGLEARGGAPPPAAPPTVWDRLWRTEGMQALVDGAKSRRPGHVRIAGPEYNLLTQKVKAAAYTLDATQFGALDVPFHRPGIIEQLTEKKDIISLIRRVPIGASRTYDYRRETELGRLGYVTATIAGAHAATVTSVNVDSTLGFVTGTRARFHLASGIREHYISVTDADTLALLTAPGGSPAQLGAAATGGEFVTSENFGASAEAGTKPGSILDYEVVTLVVQTIAEIAKISLQRMMALPQMAAVLERMLVFRLRRNLSWHLLYGSGTAPQLHGFFTATGAQTRLWSDGVVGDTRADAVLRAGVDIPEGVGPITLVLNREDWLAILTQKGPSDGHYVMTNFGPVLLVDTPTQRFLSTHPIVTDQALWPGDALVADLDIASEWIESDDYPPAFLIGYEGDGISKNVVTIRYEQSIEHAVLATSAYTKLTWDSAPV